MKIKCPECDEVMVKNEDAHVCEACDHTLTLEEAEQLFDDGKLIGIAEADDNLEEGENPFKKKEKDSDDSDDDDDEDGSDDDEKEEKDMKEESEDDDEEVVEEDVSFNGYANKETWASTIVTENEYSLLKKIKEAHKKEKLDDKFVKSLVEGAASEGDLSEVFESIDLTDVSWSEVSDHFAQVMKESEAIATDVATVLFADTELNEEQKDELVNIFETAVDIKVNEIKSGLLEDHDAKVEEAIKIKEAELEDKTAEYVDVVVEEWFEDNRIAIEDSLKVEFAEDFIDKLHDLFTESYVHVPEDRFDVVESLAEQVTQLEETVEESKTESEKTISKLEETIVEMQKEKSVIAITEGMVETEKEKLSEIIDKVDYKDEEQFVSEVNKLKEAFISKADTHLDEEKDDQKDEDKVDSINTDIAKAALM